MASCVASLVMSQSGTGRPARLLAVRFSARRISRNVCPPVTSASAFTMPPMRVAMPPAIVQKASSPFAIASSPRARRRSCSGVPSAGSLATSPGRGASTFPFTRIAGPPPGRRVALTERRSKCEEVLLVEACPVQSFAQVRVERGEGFGEGFHAGIIA